MIVRQERLGTVIKEFWASVDTEHARVEVDDSDNGFGRRAQEPCEKNDVHVQR